MYAIKKKAETINHPNFGEDSYFKKKVNLIPH